MSNVRRRWVLGALIATGCLLAVTAVAVATTAKLQGKTLTITATEGDDTIGLDVVPGVANPNIPFYEISAEDGIADVPAGCFRKDAKTIHCPVEAVDEIEFDLLGGDDTLEVGEGIDADLDAEGGPGNDDAEGGDGRDHLQGDAGRDRLNGGGGPDDREGGPGNDVLEASAGNDTQNGGGGNDKLFGGPGKDKQKGGPGNDKLVGGGGNDRQNGGGGSDRCNGGGGSDTPVSCEIGLAY